MTSISPQKTRNPATYILAAKICRQRKLRRNWMKSKGIWCGCLWIFYGMSRWRKEAYLSMSIRKVSILEKRATIRNTCSPFQADCNDPSQQLYLSDRFALKHFSLLKVNGKTGSFCHCMSTEGNRPLRRDGYCRHVTVGK